MDAAADLLVRREADADLAVGNVRVGDQVFGHGHDDGDAGLVVRTQQRRAAGRDDVLARFAGQRGDGLGARAPDLGSSGSTMGEPSQLRWTMGLTLAPLKAGAVSTWARKATAGHARRRRWRARWPALHRSRSAVTSCAPISFSSSTSGLSRSNCLAVLGVVGEDSSLSVSIWT